RGVAIADYDRDGRLDAYVLNRLGSPILYRNTTATSGHWLEVDLTGTMSNRDGCGARLIVTAGGTRQLREVFCGSVGLSSGSDTVVHFGLAGVVGAGLVRLRRGDALVRAPGHAAVRGERDVLVRLLPGGVVASVVERQRYRPVRRHADGREELPGVDRVVVDLGLRRPRGSA